MNRPLSIAPEVFARLKELPRNERAGCLQALCDLVESFGRPHVHAGLGIRKLGPRLFECRGSLDLRFIFQDRTVDLFVAFLGNHDEIKTLLRSGRYR